MIKNTIQIVLTLSILIGSTAFSKDDNLTKTQKELLIINKAVLYESETSNSKKLRILDFLEKVYLVKESSNKKIFVLTEKNEKGWVDSINTSITPSSWKKIDSFEELSIFIPSNIKYSIDKGKWENNNVNEYKEDKIYAENFFSILINRSDQTFEGRIEKIKKADKIFHRKSNLIEKYIKEKKLIFYNNVGMDFAQQYYVVLPYKENSYISILVSPDSSDPSPEEIRTVLKILFSFEMK